MELVKDNIKKVISKLDPNKLHSHDVISIPMFKMSGDAKIEALFTIRIA